MAAQIFLTLARQSPYGPNLGSELLGLGVRATAVEWPASGVEVRAARPGSRGWSVNR
jgi:hypothetical protein